LVQSSGLTRADSSPVFPVSLLDLDFYSLRLILFHRLLIKMGAGLTLGDSFACRKYMRINRLNRPSIVLLWFVVASCYVSFCRKDSCRLCLPLSLLSLPGQSRPSFKNKHVREFREEVLIRFEPSIKALFS
jgi:hypothetical protein